MEEEDDDFYGGPGAAGRDFPQSGEQYGDNEPAQKMDVSGGQDEEEEEDSDDVGQAYHA